MIGKSKDRYELDLFNRGGNKGAVERSDPQATDPKGGAPTPSGGLLMQCWNQDSGEYYEEQFDQEFMGHPGGTTSAGWDCQVGSIE